VPEVPSPALPRICGGFRLVRELGRGGMGVVYEAEELDSGRAVALKVLAADLSVSGEAFERFRREARLAAAISDAHCVFVYGAHQVEGAPAIAMELVGGETLQEKVARGDTIPIETAVRWIIDVVDGLEAAHRAGVLHRDVKPSNCFVTLDGRVKIGDFGLSRALERDVELTQSGQFLGSPLYASPEQIRGRSVDARC
jgi:serine/threonine protein kinase